MGPNVLLVVLDTASIYASSLDVPRSPAAELCIRSGYVALRTVADLPDPTAIAAPWSRHALRGTSSAPSEASQSR